MKGARGRLGRLPLLAIGLLLLGAAVRALRFGGGFATRYHWDETSPAVQALELLEGHFPVHFLGNEYMGATASYPLAAWFALAGPSPRSLDVFSYLVGVLVLWTGYLVARRLLAPPATWLALAVLAVPPLFVAARSLDGSLAHQLVLILGHAALLLTHTVFFGPAASQRRALAALGLLAGLGWWANPLILVYLAPFGWLAVRTGLAWRLRLSLFVVGVGVGGLPALAYEATHFPSARFLLVRAGTIGSAPLVERVADGATALGHIIVGMPVRAAVSGASGLVAVPLLLLGVAAIVRAAVRDRAALAWALGRRRTPASPAVLLWAVAVANVGLVVLAQRGVTTHYLLPVFLVLACWMGATLAEIWRTRRSAGAAALVLLLGFHLWSNWRATIGGVAPIARRWTPLQASLDPLVRWLDARGVGNVYWAAEAIQPWEFTYLTGRRIVASDLWREVAVTHGHRVDAAEAPPIVIEPDGPVAGALRATLSGLGMTVRETRVGGLAVLEEGPPALTGFVPLSPDGWLASASDNAEAAAALLDRDVATGWNSGTQVPGQWVAVDLGAAREVARLDLLAVDWQDVPAGFAVEASLDGRRWDRIVSVSEYWGPLFLSGPHAFLKVRRGRVQAIFRPTRARWLRLVQTGSVGYRGWSARELFLYGPGPPAGPAPAPGEVAAFLRRAGVDFAYADHWLSARVHRESGGAIGALESNMNLNDYGWTGLPPNVPETFRPEPGRGLLLGADADVDAIRGLLTAQPIELRETAAGPYRLLAFAPPAIPSRRLPHDGWRATAGTPPQSAARAVDGKERTVWRPGEPPGPDLAVTVDLGRRQRIRRLEMRPGLPGRGPEAFRLETSVDGAAWLAPGPLAWAGRLYWSGTALLRNGDPAWAVGFPPVEARFVRLRPAPRWEGAWEIAEIDVFD